MKSAADVLDSINELEHRFPVHAWHSADIDLWPAYRVRLFMDVTLAILATDQQVGRFRRATELVVRGARAVWGIPLASWRDRKMNSKIQSGTVAVFLSDGLSFTRLGDKWCDRIIDPFVLALDDCGFRSLKLTPLAQTHTPRLTSSRFIQLTIDRLKLTARRNIENLDLPQFDAFLADARTRFGSHVLGRDWLSLQANRLNRLAVWFARVLERSGARYALVNNYYSLEGMAFVQAARRMGCRSADLQHGLQGSNHAAYGRWANVAKGGYSTLPDEFWVWSDDEANAINAWRGRCESHVPRVVGNVWRDQWLGDSDPIVAGYVREARALRQGAVVPHVLVCLAWGLSDEETEKLIRAAKLSGAGVVWWWRLHPVEASRCEEFAARLRRNGLDASLVRQATNLPLYALIRAVDLTLAHSSTVIQEAAEFGVRSIVTSDYGAELHENIIQQGMCVQATTSESIAAAIIELAGRERPVPRIGNTSRVDLNLFLRSLFSPDSMTSAVQERLES